MTPSLIARAAQCLHSWHLECHGDPSLKVEPDAGQKLVFERGLDYERKVVDSLPEHVKPDWDGKDWSAGYASTMRLMRESIRPRPSCRSCKRCCRTPRLSSR